MFLPDMKKIFRSRISFASREWLNKTGVNYPICAEPPRASLDLDLSLPSPEILFHTQEFPFDSNRNSEGTKPLTVFNAQAKPKLGEASVTWFLSNNLAATTAPQEWCSARNLKARVVSCHQLTTRECTKTVGRKEPWFKNYRTRKCKSKMFMGRMYNSLITSITAKIELTTPGHLI